MELGGVGSMPICPEREEAAAKLSLEAPLRGLGMSTEAVLPARAIPMLEVAVWGAMKVGVDGRTVIA